MPSYPESRAALAPLILQLGARPQSVQELLRGVLCAHARQPHLPGVSAALSDAVMRELRRSGQLITHPDGRVQTAD